MIGLDVVGQNFLVHVENREVEHYFHVALAHGVGEFLHNIAFDAAVCCVVVGCLCIPHAEAAVVLYRHAAEVHIGRACCFGPFAAVEFGGVELRDVNIRVGPVFILIGAHAEVYEQAEF